MHGTIPTDLDREETSFKLYTLEDRIAICKRLTSIFDVDTLIRAIAITMWEQPKKVPNNNPSGWISFGRTFPWGWAARNFVAMPSGYNIITESQGGAAACNLSWASLEDHFKCLAAVTKNKGINTGADYVRSWIGTGPNSATARAFDDNVAKIEGLWGGIEPKEPDVPDEPGIPVIDDTPKGRTIVTGATFGIFLTGLALILLMNRK